MISRAAQMAMIAVLTGLTLGGCAWPWRRTPAAVAAPAVADAGPATRYTCDGGRGFSATYLDGGTRAVVRSDGATYDLPQVPAASGARYAKGKVELATKGTEAMLIGTPRPLRDCRAD